MDCGSTLHRYDTGVVAWNIMFCVHDVEKISCREDTSCVWYSNGVRTSENDYIIIINNFNKTTYFVICNYCPCGVLRSDTTEVWKIRMIRHIWTLELEDYEITTVSYINTGLVNSGASHFKWQQFQFRTVGIFFRL